MSATSSGQNRWLWQSMRCEPPAAPAARRANAAALPRKSRRGMEAGVLVFMATFFRGGGMVETPVRRRRRVARIDPKPVAERNPQDRREWFSYKRGPARLWAKVGSIARWSG